MATETRNRIPSDPAAPAEPRTRPERRPATFTVELTRAEDQTRVTYEFVDLVLRGDTLVATGPTAQPLVRMRFTPQHTAEEAVSADATPGTAPLGSVTADESVLVFEVEPPLPFVLKRLVPDATWTLLAGPKAGTGTTIEAPQAVVLAPATGTRATSYGARHDGISELWTLRVDPGPLTVVANAQQGDHVASRSPDSDERDDLVVLTRAADPVDGRRLWLSLHGAFLDLLGEWDEDETAPLGTDVVRWLHRAVAGRDLEIEVTTRGFLAPFGHRASMVTITEREVTTDTAGEPTAVLVQETHLAVTEPTLDFPRPYMPDDGRALPFTAVTIADVPNGPVTKRQITWSDVGGDRDMNLDNAWHVVDQDGGDVVVAYTAVDRVGNAGIAFEAPASFIAFENAFALRDGAPPANLADYLSDDESRDRRTIDVGGADVAWADPIEPGSLATVKPTDRIELRLVSLDDSDPSAPTKAELMGLGQPNLFPAVVRAWVLDEAFAGTLEEPDDGLEVAPHPRWLEHGDGTGNHDDAYLRIPDTPTFSVGGDGRAVVALDLETEIYNQQAGVARESDGPDDSWDPLAALGDGARILGSILLADIVDAVDLSSAVPGVDIPGLTVDLDEQTGIVTTCFSFEPRLRDLGSFVTYGSDARASVELCSEVDLTGGAPRAWADVEVRDFSLVVPPGAPAVTLHYRSVSAHVPDDGAVDVDYDLEDWELGGLLTWVQPLLETLADLGASARIDITSERLLVDIGVAPPPVELGVLTIRNFEIGTSVELPFDAPVAIGVGVGRPERPVEISLLGFEGSFFLVVEIGGEGTELRRLEIGAETTVQLFGLDLVVAEVAVDLGLAGFFLLEQGAVSFGGSVTLEGVVDVLGLISVTAGIVGAVAYHQAPAEEIRVTGTITYAVDTILTKPKEGSLPLGAVTYPLGDGAGAAGALATAATATTGTGSLSFGDRFSQDDWIEYTGAFADA